MLQANGGYLIMNAMDVLRSPFAWDALKRIIKKNEVKIEDIGELYGIATAGIKPEPIPISLKIIMLGSPWLYYLLYYYDEEFRSIFKVKSDFDTQMDVSREEKARYANFIGAMAAEEKLLPFSREAVAEVIDYAARLAEKKGKLSLRFSDLSDLVREASSGPGARKSALWKRGTWTKRWTRRSTGRICWRSDPGAPDRRHHHGGHHGRGHGPGERPVGLRPRRFLLRQAVADHLPCLYRQGRRGGHRA